MAHTEKTNPLWVQLADGRHKASPWHRTPVGSKGALRTAIGPHDCDLPGKPSRRDTNCIWLFEFTGKNVCCCNMCKAFGFDEPPSRKARRDKRRAIAEQLT